jgi:predicted esterase
VIRQCHQFALKYVAPSRLFLFGFSQGACLLSSYLLGRYDTERVDDNGADAKVSTLQLAGVIALSGGLCGDEEEIKAYEIQSERDCRLTSLAGLRVILASSEEDSHVPRDRVSLTARLFVERGAHVQCDYFPGGEHKIFPASATKARALFAEVVSSGSLIGGNGTVSGGERGTSAKSSQSSDGGDSQEANTGGARERVDPFAYLHGYMALLESEALPGAVPRAQRSPHHVPYGLYAECVTGSPFCAPRAVNLSAWLYRIHPSIGTHGAFKPYMQPSSAPNHGAGIRGDFCCPGNSFTPEPQRWQPTPIRSEPHDFVDGLVTLAGTGNPMSVKGMAIHVYTCNKDMVRRERSLFQFALCFLFMLLFFVICGVLLL